MDESDKTLLNETFDWSHVNFRQQFCERTGMSDKKRFCQMPQVDFMGFWNSQTLVEASMLANAIVHRLFLENTKLTFNDF